MTVLFCYIIIGDYMLTDYRFIAWQLLDSCFYSKNLFVSKKGRIKREGMERN